MENCGKNKTLTLDEFKKWAQLNSIPQDELLERLYYAETAVAKFQQLMALPALERHKLAEMFRDCLKAFAGGASLRQTANDIVDVFVAELIKRSDDNDDDGGHCGGYGCMCGTD